MKTYYDCIPCFTKQALDAARFASDDTEVHETVLRKALMAISEMDMKKTPPEMGALIYRIVSQYANNKDPYKQIKKRFNQIALELYPELINIRDDASRPFETAARLAIAGNIIDFGVGVTIDKALLIQTIEKTLKDELFGDVKSFEEAVNKAKKIVYLGDNSGEVVFDKILIEQIIAMKGSADNLTFVVRGEPIINDITMVDARETGMTDIVKVIDNGQGYPGTVLSECSEEFLKYFNEADIIISKGQGNYETLSNVERNIFFLLKAKCNVVAEDLGCEVGTSVIGSSKDFI